MHKKMRIGVVHIMNVLNIAPKLNGKEWVGNDQYKISDEVDHQEEADKENIVKGYNQLQYLLNHWVEETTICKTGGDYNAKVCDRTPLKVMDYLGYRSTTSPLFKADKTMLRLYSLVPASKDAEYLEAMERYSENADEASGMAYISSWGEANPGGGKDRVELFIERAKKNVITSRDCLATVMNILDIKP